MSASELQGLIQTKTAPLLGSETTAILRGILELAETETILQVRSIPVTPTTDPGYIQETTSAIRSELTAEAVMSFLNSMQASIAAATAQAVVEYLDNHSSAAYIPGSLVAGTYPVTPVSGFPAISEITY